MRSPSEGGCVATIGNCPGRARAFREAACGDCLPVTRRRFRCGLPHSDAAAADASELLVLRGTASVTHAPVASLSQPRGVTPRRDGSIGCSNKTGQTMQHVQNALPTIGMDNKVEFGCTAVECHDKPSSSANTKANNSAGTQRITTYHETRCMPTFCIFHVRLK